MEKITSVRIINVDYYMGSPIENYDVFYSDFRGSSTGRVPIIRIFGATETGPKICLHVHKVFPYIYIPYDGYDDPNKLMYQVAAELDKNINISFGQASSNAQHVYKVSLVSGIPMYGYHAKEHQFFKIALYNPLLVRKVGNILENNSLLGKMYQPHEIHVPYILQFMIDYNLHGMSFIHLSELKYRENCPADIESKHCNTQISKQSYCELEADCLAENILNRLEVASGQVATNPGIAALWEDEKQRRRNKNQNSQIGPCLSMESNNVKTTNSHNIFKQALQDRITILESEIDKDVTCTDANSSVYPAETPDDNCDILDASIIEHPAAENNSFLNVSVENPLNVTLGDNCDAIRLYEVLKELQDVKNNDDIEEGSVLSQDVKDNDEQISEEEQDADLSVAMQQCATPKKFLLEEKTESDDDIWDTTIIPQLDGNVDDKDLEDPSLPDYNTVVVINGDKQQCNGDSFSKNCKVKEECIELGKKLSVTLTQINESDYSNFLQKTVKHRNKCCKNKKLTKPEEISKIDVTENFLHFDNNNTNADLFVTNSCIKNEIYLKDHINTTPLSDFDDIKINVEDTIKENLECNELADNFINFKDLKKIDNKIKRERFCGFNSMKSKLQNCELLLKQKEVNSFQCHTGGFVLLTQVNLNNNLNLSQIINKKWYLNRVKNGKIVKLKMKKKRFFNKSKATIIKGIVKEELIKMNEHFSEFVTTKYVSDSTKKPLSKENVVKPFKKHKKKKKQRNLSRKSLPKSNNCLIPEIGKSLGNEILKNQLKKRVKNKKNYFIPGTKPRKSPRNHASTIAISSTSNENNTSPKTNASSNRNEDTSPELIISSPTNKTFVSSLSSLEQKVITSIEETETFKHEQSSPTNKTFVSSLSSLEQKVITYIEETETFKHEQSPSSIKNLDICSDKKFIAELSENVPIKKKCGRVKKIFKVSPSHNNNNLLVENNNNNVSESSKQLLDSTENEPDLPNEEALVGNSTSQKSTILNKINKKPKQKIKKPSNIIKLPKKNDAPKREKNVRKRAEEQKSQFLSDKIHIETPIMRITRSQKLKIENKQEAKSTEPKVMQMTLDNFDKINIDKFLIEHKNPLDMPNLGNSSRHSNSNVNNLQVNKKRTKNVSNFEEILNNLKEKAERTSSLKTTPVKKNTVVKKGAVTKRGRGHKKKVKTLIPKQIQDSEILASLNKGNKPKFILNCAERPYVFEESIKTTEKTPPKINIISNIMISPGLTDMNHDQINVQYIHDSVKYNYYLPIGDSNKPDSELNIDTKISEDSTLSSFNKAASPEFGCTSDININNEQIENNDVLLETTNIIEDTAISSKTDCSISTLENSPHKNVIKEDLNNTLDKHRNDGKEKSFYERYKESLKFFNSYLKTYTNRGSLCIFKMNKALENKENLSESSSKSETKTTEPLILQKINCDNFNKLGSKLEQKLLDGANDSSSSSEDNIESNSKSKSASSRLKRNRNSLRGSPRYQPLPISASPSKNKQDFQGSRSRDSNISNPLLKRTEVQKKIVVSSVKELPSNSSVDKVKRKINFVNSSSFNKTQIEDKIECKLKQKSSRKSSIKNCTTLRKSSRLIEKNYLHCSKESKNNSPQLEKLLLATTDHHITDESDCDIFELGKPKQNENFVYNVNLVKVVSIIEHSDAKNKSLAVIKKDLVDDSLSRAQRYDIENNYLPIEGSSKDSHIVISQNSSESSMDLPPSKQETILKQLSGTDLLQSSGSSMDLPPPNQETVLNETLTQFSYKKLYQSSGSSIDLPQSNDDTLLDKTLTQFSSKEVNQSSGSSMDLPPPNQESDKLGNANGTPLRKKICAPTRQMVLNSLSSLNIPSVQHKGPFYGNFEDVTAGVEVGLSVLKIASNTTAYQQDFESTFEAFNVFRKQKFESLSSNLKWNYNNLKTVKLSFCKNADCYVTPALKAPTRSNIKNWIKEQNTKQLSALNKNTETPRKRTKIYIPTSPGGGGDEDSDLDLSLTLTPTTPVCSHEGKTNNSESTPKSSVNKNNSESSPVLGNKSKKRRKLEFNKIISSQTLRKSILMNQSQGSMNDSCRISGVSKNNTFGFNASVLNLQNARALSIHQHLTILITELHVRTRGDFKPNPEYDSIRAIFYTVTNDIPDNETKPKKCKGIIAINSIPISPTKGSKYNILDGTGVTSLNITYVDTEEELINKYITKVREWDPDIIAGYEIEMLSLGYLIDRAYTLSINLPLLLSRIKEDVEKSSAAKHTDECKITGRIVLDVWRLMRHEIALRNYSFENIYYHVFQKRVPKYSYKDLSFWWDHRYSIYRHQTINYYMLRVEGITQLFDKLDLINRTSELAKLFGIQFYEVLSRGSQFRVESMMLRLAKPNNFIPVSPTVAQRASMRAPEFLPLIMEPESKFYVDPIIVLDFQSLYPSMIIAYNYCFTTCLGKVQLLGKNVPFEFGATQLKVSRNRVKWLLKHDKLNISPCGVAFVKAEVRDGILPRMLREILDTRLMVKKSMKENKDDSLLQKVLHNRQLGLKLIANVTYGYTAANFSGRMPSVEVGDSVVSKGRETLQRAIAMVNETTEWGARVVYGDTDSLFVMVPGKSKEEAFEIGQKIADAVTNDNPSPVKLKLEKVYYPCILQTKKRYVGYMYESKEQKEPVFLAKGIETVRRDGCPAVAKVLEKCLKLLFETKNISLIKQYVIRQFNKILIGRVNIQDLTFSKEYRGASNYRPGACVPALELTKKWTAVDKRNEPRKGERVPYIIINGPPGLPLIRLVRSPSELLNDSSLRPNALYYITKVIIPPINRCFNLIGADVNSWFAQMPRKQIQYLPSSTPSPSKLPKKFTISQYFASMSCACCGTQTQTKLCEDCCSKPQSTAVVLLEKIQEWEQSYYNVKLICESCTGTVRETSCISLDCPVLYRSSQTSRDLQQAPYVREIFSEKLLEF